MRPSLGAMKPVMMANSVVLPAPFGPISAVMRPASAVNDARVDGEQAAEAARDILDPQQLSHAGAPPVWSGTARAGWSNNPAMPRGANATTRTSTAP